MFSLRFLKASLFFIFVFLSLTKLSAKRLSFSYLCDVLLISASLFSLCTKKQLNLIYKVKKTPPKCLNRTGNPVRAIALVLHTESVSIICNILHYRREVWKFSGFFSNWLELEFILNFLRWTQSRSSYRCLILENLIKRPPTRSLKIITTIHFSQFIGFSRQDLVGG